MYDLPVASNQSFNREWGPFMSCIHHTTLGLGSSIHTVSLPARLWLAGGGSHVTENDVTLPQVAGSDVIWPEVTWKWLWKVENSCMLCVSLPARLWLAGGGTHVTGNDVTWPQVTGSYPEVTSFDRKSPGSGCRRPKSRVYFSFHFLQGCDLQEEALTWQEMMSCDLGWPEVTLKWRHLTESNLEVAVEGLKLAHTVCFTSYKVVARRSRH